MVALLWRQQHARQRQLGDGFTAAGVDVLGPPQLWVLLDPIGIVDGLDVSRSGVGVKVVFSGQGGHLAVELLEATRQVRLHDTRRLPAAAPPAPTPPARCRPPPLAPTQGAQRKGVEPPINRRPSPTYRSHCRPGPGAASGNRQPAAGATAESMSRTRTGTARARKGTQRVRRRR
jgi:hypothetical protein